MPFRVYLREFARKQSDGTWQMADRQTAYTQYETINTIQICWGKKTTIFSQCFFFCYSKIIRLRFDKNMRYGVILNKIR